MNISKVALSASVMVGLLCLSAGVAEAKSSYSVPEDGTIAEVIAAANADSEAKTVTLGADVYQLAATLEITGAYRVEGATGNPAEVTIKPASKVVLQPVVKVSNAGAMLASVTVMGGTGSGVEKDMMGGNVYNAGGTVTNCCLINTATGKSVWGGGIVNDNGLVTGCVITNNCAAGGWGTGAAQTGADAVMENCLIAGNQGTCHYNYGGGGLYLEGGIVRGCVITNNCDGHLLTGSYQRGGGIYVPSKAVVTIENCLIANNWAGASGGGGIYLNSGTADCVIRGCTIVGNRCRGGSAGLQLGAACTVEDTVIWDNWLTSPSANPAADELSTGQVAKFRNVCSKGGYGADPITEDPKFVNPAAGDYRVSATSACCAHDCGAFGWDKTVFAVGIEGVDGPVPAGTVTLSAAAVGATGEASYRFRLDDALAGTEGTWGDWGEGTYSETLAAGRYTLRVEAKDETGSVRTDARAFVVASKTVYLVTAGTAGNAPVAPYATEETAANDLASALVYCGDGTTLRIGDGDFQVTGRQVVTKAVRIESVNGPEKTSISRKGAYKSGTISGVLKLTSPLAELIGVTIANGYIPASGFVRDVGSGLWFYGSTVSNCVVKKCATGCDGMSGGSTPVANFYGKMYNCIVRENENIGRFGGGLYAKGATVVDCAISNNFCTIYSTCTGLGVNMDGGMMLRTVVSDNRLYVGGNSGTCGGLLVSGNNAEVRNCLIVGNKAAKNGGGVYVGKDVTGATFVNCTIANNNALNGGGVAMENENSSATFINCLFWGNTDNAASQSATQPTWHNLNTAKCTFSHNAVPAKGAQLGETDFVIENPGFVQDGYALTLASEARDKGDNYDWTDADVDLVYNPRILKDIVDIGCYEFVPSGELTVGYTVTGWDRASSALHCAASVDGAAPGEYECRWSYRDLGTGADGEWTAWSTSTETDLSLPAGRYLILLEVKKDEKTIAYDDGKGLRVVSPTVLLVTAEGRTGAPAYPYATPDTAAEDLVTALTACGIGTELIVGPGAYPVESEVEVGPGVVIRSEEGPGRTSFFLKSALADTALDSRVLNLQTKAELHGFAVSNGYIRSSMGSAVYGRDGAIVSNCVFKANKATYQCGGQLALVNARAYDCDFSGCVSTDYGSQGQGIYLEGADAYATRICVHHNDKGGSYNGGQAVLTAGALIEDSILVSNKHTAAGSVISLAGGACARKCLIAMNQLANDAPVRFSGRGSLENCTVVSNSSTATWLPTAVRGNIVEPGSKYTAGVTNCLFWGNVAGNAEAPDAIVGDNASLAIDHSLIRATEAERISFTDCFEADPLFRNEARQNFHLRYSSPCTFAGLVLPWQEGRNDLSGRPWRKIQPAIGCYESGYGLSVLVR